MAKTATAPEQLRKGTKVRALTHLRDVAKGTKGKVILVDGLSWIRYWVRFDNGVYLGSVPRQDLATPEQWQRHLSGEDEPSEVAGATSSAEADAGGDGDEGAGGGGKATPSGTVVPQKLLERSAAARARLAG